MKSSFKRFFRRRLPIYGLLCLVAFTARQSVFLTHDCDVMGTGILAAESRTAIAVQSVKAANEPDCHHHGEIQKPKEDSPEKAHHHHEHHAGGEHDHDECPVCLVYEQLLQGSTVETHFSLMVENSRVALLTVAPVQLLIISGFNHSTQPRAPPALFLV